MLPGFAYGAANETNAKRQRAASIVLATDNIVSGQETYSLTGALDLTEQTMITVDGLYSGPKTSESDQTTADMNPLSKLMAVCSSPNRMARPSMNWYVIFSRAETPSPTTNRRHP